MTSPAVNQESCVDPARGGTGLLSYQGCGPSVLGCLADCKPLDWQIRRRSVSLLADGLGVRERKGMKFQTVRWVSDGIEILDQTLLPGEERYICLNNYQEVIEAIKHLRVRGAPLIGIVAAYGVVLAARSCHNKIEFAVAINEVKNCRPTAVNLSWAVERMLITYHAYDGSPERDSKLVELAHQIHIDDAQMCDAIGERGAELLSPEVSVLTHCNAGALATGGSGTALSIIYHAHQAGKRVKVYADETRPILQGSRLTAWELAREGIDVTVITDNMAGHLMASGLIDCVIVGTDRVAANYDIANKIGTYSVAVLAKEHGIPFYVAAPTSTFDNQIASGAEIQIEQRDPREISHFGARQITPTEVKVLNPAFDITPHELITAIITDREIVKCGRWTDGQ
jgi:methylthioribose-1-phosphate isomerase